MAQPKTKQHKTPADPHKVRIRALSDEDRTLLATFYFEKDLSFRQIAALVGGVSFEAIRRALSGRRMRPRTAFKIERFLRGVSTNAA